MVVRKLRKIGKAFSVIRSWRLFLFEISFTVEVFVSTKKIILVLFLSVFLSMATGLPTSLAIASTPTGGSATLDGEVWKYIQIPVSFVTDRQQTGNTNPRSMYGGDRAKNLSYGITYVSIPRLREVGELKDPPFWEFLFLGEDPTKYISLRNIENQTRDEFYSLLASRVRYSAEKKAFIFVHGYNVTFEDAAKRTAQITYDLKFDGASVFYSWPAQGEIKDYFKDSANVEWTQATLKNFLEDFFVKTEAQNVYLIAHSMGTRAMAGAVKSLMLEKPDLMEKLTEIILAAPDIDADIFKRDIAPIFVNLRKPVTIYASSNDMALKASEVVNGYPRSGLTGKHLVVVEGIETIDASAVNTSLMGHSFYAEEAAVLEDIFYLINHRARAEKRFGLKSTEKHGSKYWVLEK